MRYPQCCCAVIILKTSYGISTYASVQCTMRPSGPQRKMMKGRRIMTNYSTRNGDDRSTLPEILGASALIQTGPGGEVVARTVDAVRQGLRSMLAGIEHLRRRRVTSEALYDLDDATLKDIGVQRNDIPFIADRVSEAQNDNRPTIAA